jgi:translocation and assembly module TamB
MRLMDLRVSDPKGVFLSSPRLDVDWRPFAYTKNQLIRDETAARIGIDAQQHRPDQQDQAQDREADPLPATG